MVSKYLVKDCTIEKFELAVGMRASCTVLEDVCYFCIIRDESKDFYNVYIEGYEGYETYWDKKYTSKQSAIAAIRKYIKRHNGIK